MSHTEIEMLPEPSGLLAEPPRRPPIAIGAAAATTDVALQAVSARLHPWREVVGPAAWRLVLARLATNLLRYATVRLVRPIGCEALGWSTGARDAPARSSAHGGGFRTLHGVAVPYYSSNRSSTACK